MNKLTVTLSIAFLLPACSTSDSSGSTTTTTTNRAANAATTTTTTTNSSGTTPTTATTSSVTGVAACDEYLAKVEMCLSKPSVPEATKTTYRQSLEQNRTAWKQAASTAPGKASLETSCKIAADSAKPFFDSCK